MNQTRDLTPQEDRAVNFIRQFEEATGWTRDVDVSACRKYIVLYMTEQALEVLQRLQLCEPTKVIYDEHQRLFKVYMLTGEFRKYVDSITAAVGMKIEMDGTIKTFDGYTIRPVERKS